MAVAAATVESRERLAKLLEQNRKLQLEIRRLRELLISAGYPVE